MLKWFVRSLAGAIVVGGWQYWRVRQNLEAPPSAESLIRPIVGRDPIEEPNITSVPNFRDIGGYHTHDGQRVRGGYVFRASRLSNLSEADMETLSKMGIQLVCDLRTEEEVLASPDHLPEGITIINLPAHSKERRWTQVVNLLFKRNFVASILGRIYTDVMIDGNSHIFVEIFRRIASPDNLPIVIHCTAGKDRTGLVIAFLLTILGVPQETVIADYTQSNQHLDFFRTISADLTRQIRRFGISDEQIDHLYIADGEVLRRAFVHIGQKYGSVENYLLMHGVSAETLVQIRRNLLEPRS